MKKYKKYYWKKKLNILIQMYNEENEIIKSYADDDGNILNPHIVPEENWDRHRNILGEIESTIEMYYTKETKYWCNIDCLNTHWRLHRYKKKNKIKLKKSYKNKVIKLNEDLKNNSKIMAISIDPTKGANACKMYEHKKGQWNDLVHEIIKKAGNKNEKKF